MSFLKKSILKSYNFRIKFSHITGLGISVNHNKNNIKPMTDFYSLNATSINGEEISFEKFRGKNVLLVNLASQCGYTPQYADLEKLNQLHKNNVVLLGFPSNDFGAQEPGNDEEIQQFCKINFGVTFQLFHKDRVSGTGKQPVYQWLSDSEKNGWNSKEPSWNFTKYLVDKNGNLKNIFSSSVSPMGEEILKEIG